MSAAEETRRLVETFSFEGEGVEKETDKSLGCQSQMRSSTPISINPASTSTPMPVPTASPIRGDNVFAVDEAADFYDHDSFDDFLMNMSID